VPWHGLLRGHSNLAPHRLHAMRMARGALENRQGVNGPAFCPKQHIRYRHRVLLVASVATKRHSEAHLRVARALR
ncbi:hypothetical protein, partial [Pseudacidovorax intermedius]|uniref:hypothetical protein n=1 Tax=Pseudacidovorax intermedius TaxID=433924 RepID=UPI001E567025